MEVTGRHKANASSITGRTLAKSQLSVNRMGCLVPISEGIGADNRGPCQAIPRKRILTIGDATKLVFG